ncbi:hypothetical protein ACFP51_32185 [Streptomyces pratens]|uniref:Uncharacterized protein n=1 Tax=Streptomyces pratens TaxID=887456 RepID=A0ABW1M8X9_9ACTN
MPRPSRSAPWAPSSVPPSATPWAQALHVPLPGFDERVLYAADLAALARRLCG